MCHFQFFCRMVLVTKMRCDILNNRWSVTRGVPNMLNFLCYLKIEERHNYNDTLYMQVIIRIIRYGQQRREHKSKAAGLTRTGRGLSSRTCSAWRCSRRKEAEFRLWCPPHPGPWLWCLPTSSPSLSSKSSQRTSLRVPARYPDRNKSLKGKIEEMQITKGSDVFLRCVKCSIHDSEKSKAFYSKTIHITKLEILNIRINIEIQI